MRRRATARSGAVVLVAALTGVAAACAPTQESSGSEAAASPPRSGEATRSAPAVDLPPPPAVPRPAAVSGIAPLPADDVPAVIVLEPSVRYAFPLPAERPMMDQIATRFTPAAIVVRTGQPVDFRNDDPTLHNVRVRERGRRADDLAFNIALQQGVTYDYTFQADAAWDVRCDVHQNMYGLVVSTASPYAAVAAADGSYTIAGLPPGEYTAIAYTSRERFEVRIAVAAGERRTLSWR